MLGYGELGQYDLSDPHNPKEAGSVRLGGIASRTPHPAVPDLRLAGAPQLVEVSCDGRRVYATNSLYASCDDIFDPDGVGARTARIDADIESGGTTLDPRFFPTATTSAGCGFTRPAYKPGTRRATRTASWTRRRTTERRQDRRRQPDLTHSTRRGH
jgi:56kDa selenium binding protein (SBP56)